MGTDPQRRAAETIKTAGIAGEHGLAVAEGFASSKAQTFDDLLGDVIPGASMLVNGARRVVLVTDQNVHLFRGSRYDRPRERLGSYGVGADAVSFDGEKLRFADDQVVYLSNFQAQTVTQAAGADMHVGMTRTVLQHAGITGERGVMVAQGTVPKTAKNSMGARAFDFVLGGGDLDFRETVHQRIVLVTDKHVYVFEGRPLMRPGAMLATYPVGPGVLSQDNARVAFHDGQFIDLPGATQARRIADAAAGITS